MYLHSGIAFGVLVSLASTVAADHGSSTKAALKKYCEPLIAGATASRVKEIARADGMTEEVIAEQPMLRAGELLVGVSDAPRVCAVQAPPAMTFDEGAALVDQWGKSKAGAIKSTAVKGPDGAPVRAWTVPALKMALIGSYQPHPSGGRVWNFILMPIQR